MLLAKPGARTGAHTSNRATTCARPLMITLLNPKAILFYMAFFPLFVDPRASKVWVTYALMASTIAALTFLYGLAATLLTHFLAQRMRANPWIGTGAGKNSRAVPRWLWCQTGPVQVNNAQLAHAPRIAPGTPRSMGAAPLGQRITRSE